MDCLRYVARFWGTLKNSPVMASLDQHTVAKFNPFLYLVKNHQIYTFQVWIPPASVALLRVLMVLGGASFIFFTLGKTLLLII